MFKYGKIPVRRRINPETLGFTFAYPNGLSVLKDDPHKYRHINGIFLRTDSNFYYFQFRRTTLSL